MKNLNWNLAILKEVITFSNKSKVLIIVITGDLMTVKFEKTSNDPQNEKLLLNVFGQSKTVVDKIEPKCDKEKLKISE